MVLAGLLVLFALLVPNELGRITPAAFLRLPVEAILAVAVALVLPSRVRRPVAALAGLVLSVLLIVKLVDIGFHAVLARPFDLVLDWILFDSAVDFLIDSVGRVGAIGAVIGIGALAVTVGALITVSMLRLTHLVARHQRVAGRTALVLSVAWVTCGALGVEVLPGVPIADQSTTLLVRDRVLQVRMGLRDQEAFAREASVDPFRDVPGDQLLTALRGKDVVLAFVESYGRDAVEDPEFAQVGALLEEGGQRLAAAGYAAQSAFLTSPTAGGGSWLAHATLLSGLWINNQQRYRNLVSSDRMTLNRAFQRASWRTVAGMPAIVQAWPEGQFFGYDKIYALNNLGYRGPKFSYAPMPDQYTLATFQRAERDDPNHPPIMAELALVSSHAPWAPLPKLIDWNDVGDGAVYGPIAAAGESPDEVWRDNQRVRTEYGRAIEYSLSTLISYVETYGDDDLVLIFVGDHQPAPLVTGEGASKDVPISIVTRDRAVLDRISGWGWHDGLKPGPQAPVWRMDAFRDRFLTAFGPQPTRGE